MSTTLWLYDMPGTTFQLADENAGYYTSGQAVMPRAVAMVSTPVEALVARGAVFRVVPRLRSVAERVISSTLSVSVIRLRHAAP